MTVFADPAAGVAAYLRSVVGDRLDTFPDGHGADIPAVFRPKLPQIVENRMPMTCIVVRPGGGYKLFGTGRMPVADPVLDIVCYAAVDQDAADLAIAVGQNLRMLTMGVWENCKLYWARIAGGPLPLPDAQTLWPAFWLAAQVMHATIATAGN